jgi:hypothetical protein
MLLTILNKHRKPSSIGFVFYSMRSSSPQTINTSFTSSSKWGRDFSLFHLLIHGLFKDAASSSDNKDSINLVIDNELEIMWKEAVMAQCKIPSRYLPKWLRKTTIYLSQDRRPPDRDYNARIFKNFQKCRSFGLYVHFYSHSKWSCI